MSNNTVNAALRRLGYSNEQMTGHGFRSMPSALLNEAGWHPDALERQRTAAAPEIRQRAYVLVPTILRAFELPSCYLDLARDPFALPPWHSAALARF